LEGIAAEVLKIDKVVDICGNFGENMNRLVISTNTNAMAFALLI